MPSIGLFKKKWIWILLLKNSLIQQNPYNVWTLFFVLLELQAI